MGKNYSVLITETGAIHLAPLYDCAPLYYLDPTFRDTGFAIGGIHDLTRVRLSHLVEAGRTLGLLESEATVIIEDIRDLLVTQLESHPFGSVTQEIGQALTAQFGAGPVAAMNVD